MRRKYTRFGLALGAVVLTGGLTACGSDSGGGSNGSGDKDSSAEGGNSQDSEESPEEEADNGMAEESGNAVVTKAAEGLKSAKSLKVDMQMKQATGDVTLSLAVDESANCVGTIGMGQGKAEIIKQGEKVWLKPDAAFWAAQAGAGGGAAHQMLNGRYLAGTTSDQMMSSLAETCDLSTISNEGSTDEAEGWSDPKPTTTDGQEVVVVERTKDSTKTALHVTTKGTPYAIQAVKSGKENGTIKYSDYNEPVPSKTPSAQESLNVAELEQLGR